MQLLIITLTLILIGYLVVKHTGITLNLKNALILGAVVLALLIATGRVHWISAVIAASIPAVRALAPLLVRLAPILHQAFQKQRFQKPDAHQQSPQHSTVTTLFLKMTLSHETGEIDGNVLKGALSGKKLSELDEDQLRQLLGEVSSEDEDGLTLLNTYLQQRFGEDAEQRFQQQDRNHNQSNRQRSDPSQMSTAEAREILGVSADATKAEISRAYKKLMQKLHPDRGGNAYLAAKVNCAKDTLLKK